MVKNRTKYQVAWLLPSFISFQKDRNSEQTDKKREKSFIDKKSEELAMSGLVISKLRTFWRYLQDRHYL